MIDPRKTRQPHDGKDSFVVYRHLLCLYSIALLLLAAGCGSGAEDGTPDYPVTVIGPGLTPEPTPTSLAADTATSELMISWDDVTLLPLKTPEVPLETTDEPAQIPDPLTEADRDLLVTGQGPFMLSEAEITLGQAVLPLGLLDLEGPYSVQSVEIENAPGWRFLALSSSF